MYVIIVFGFVHRRRKANKNVKAVRAYLMCLIKDYDRRHLRCVDVLPYRLSVSLMSPVSPQRTPEPFLIIKLYFTQSDCIAPMLPGYRHRCIIQ